MNRLALKLLGTPQISLAGAPLPALGMRKAEALLFYLAVNQQPYTRSALAGLFWPEVADADAKNNLRRVLPRLRALLGDYLRIDRQTVAFNNQAAYWLDMEHFTATLAPFGQAAPPAALDFGPVAQALTLYQGEFLAGFYVRAAPAFEEWVLAQREQLRLLALRGLTALADVYIAQGAHSAGFAATQQLLALEPWSEAGHFQQMVLLAQMGQRAAALAQYEQGRTLLAAEFGAQPLPLLTAFYEQLKHGDADAAVQSILQRSAGKPGDLIATQRAKPPAGADEPLFALPAVNTTAASARQVDWGESPHIATFYGRETELHQLTRWLIVERRPLVLVLGAGGVGKTTLAAHWMQQVVQGTTATAPVAPLPFTRLIWRSLRNAPPLATILRIWLQALTEQQLTTLPATVDEQLSLLFTHLRRTPALLILDNWESILSAGDAGVGYLPGYENYDLLLQQFSNGQTQSALLLTSRETNLAMARLVRDYPAVRTLSLPGVPVATGVELLQAGGLTPYDGALAALVQRYSGNPLALKLVAETVLTYYQGDSAAFLQAESAIFDDIRQVLDQQVARVSPLEWAILRWLAIERTPVSVRRLQQNFVQPPTHGALLAALRALHRRSLVEQTLGEQSSDRGEDARQFGLQNVVLEYLTDRLQETLHAELTQERLHDFLHFALVQAQALDYVRAAQGQFLLQPLARRLEESYGKAGIGRKLAQVRQTLRTIAPEPTGYGAANLLHLAFHLGIAVAGWDFSHLTIRQADLRNRRLPAVNFAQADFVQTAWLEKFQAILAVAVCPHGERIAAGGASGDLYLWRLQDGQRLALGPGHGRWLWAVAFSPDGAVVASGTAGGAILLWLVADLTQAPANRAAAPPPAAVTLHGHTDAVFGLAFHPTQAEFASVGADQRICLWDLTRKELRRTLLGHTASVYAVAYHPSGAFLVSAGRDQTIRLWDGATGECRQRLTHHQALITRLCFSGDGAWLVSSSVDGVIAVWQMQGLEQGDPLHLQFHQQIGPAPTEIVALALSRDGQTIAANGPDGAIRLWQRTTGALVRTLTGHSATVQALAFTPDGQRLVSGGWDQRIRCWQLATGDSLRTWQGYTNEVTALALSPDGRTLISATTDATLARWDVTSQQVAAIQATSIGTALTLAFHPQGQSLAVGGDQGLRLWTFSAGQLALRQSLRSQCDTIVTLAFHPTGTLLAGGSRDGAICLWDEATGGLRQVLQGHRRTVAALAFHPAGRCLVSGDDAGQLLSWQPAADDVQPWTATPLGEIPGGITTLAFSPTGALLAGAGPDHTIFLWRMADATLLATIAMPVYSTVYALAFNPKPTGDRLLLISGSGNGALACWAIEPQTGAAHLCYLRQEHQRSVRALLITPDGATIISGSADETIKFWAVESGVCVTTLALAQPYQGMNITDAIGLTSAQQRALKALGANDA